MAPYKLVKSVISYIVLSVNNFSIFNLSLDLISNEVKSIHLSKLAVHHFLLFSKIKQAENYYFRIPGMKENISPSVHCHPDRPYRPYVTIQMRGEKVLTSMIKLIQFCLPRANSIR
jgi:hypothetical protein